MSVNTLFYSKHCKHCKNFILQLKAHNLLDIFPKKICIDDPIIRNNLPPFLKEVPTIITDDYDKPMASDMAFKWISFKVKEASKPAQQSQSRGNQQQSCSATDPQCFSFNNSFDNFGSLESGNAYGGLGDTNNLKKGGKGSTGSINYESFSLIDPTKAGKKGSTGSIDYDSFKLGGDTQNNKVQSSAGQGDFDKRLEKMQKMRAMDNNFFGNDGSVRQG